MDGEFELEPGGVYESITGERREIVSDLGSLLIVRLVEAGERTTRSLGEVFMVRRRDLAKWAVWEIA